MTILDFNSLEFAPYTYNNSQGVIFRGQKDGIKAFSCLQSWEHLGDPSLSSLLDEVKNKAQHPLLLRSLENLNLDFQFKKEGKKLCDNFALKSHLQIQENDFSRLNEFSQQGFRILKLKIRNEIQLTNFLNISKEAYHFRWRLDFNFSISQGLLVEHIKNAPQDLIDAIDFLEDPFLPMSDWKEFREETKLKLALDFNNSSKNYTQYNDDIDYLIVKPARDNIFELVDFAHKNLKRVVFTSYKQHPLGQAFDFYWAQKLTREHPLLCDDCGFLDSTATLPSPFGTQENSLSLNLNKPGLESFGNWENFSWQRLL